MCFVILSTDILYCFYGEPTVADIALWKIYPAQVTVPLAKLYSVFSLREANNLFY